MVKALFRTSSARERGTTDAAQLSPARRVRSVPTDTRIREEDEARCTSGADPKSDGESDDGTGEATNDSFRGQLDETLSDALSPDDGSTAPSEVESEASMAVLMRYMGLSTRPYMEGKGSGPKRKKASVKRPKLMVSTEQATDDPSEARGETSMSVLSRYMRCSGPIEEDPDSDDLQYKHDLREGDHVIRWKMLGYCYPIQVHGIVFSVGPDFVTIVDCGMASTTEIDKAGNFDGEGKKKAKKTRRRMNILTLADEKEIKKWSKIRYGEEVQLKVHSANAEMQRKANEKDAPGEEKRSPGKRPNDTEDSSSAGLEMEEVEQCVHAKIKTSPEKSAAKSPTRSPSSWFSWSTRNMDSPVSGGGTEESQSIQQQDKAKEKPQSLWLPNADPPMLVLARLRFLLEYGEGPFPPPSDEDAEGKSKEDTTRPNLLPPNHLLYANSECIAVFCKTGSWSTLQAAIFLHSSTVGNAKQTGTVAMLLSAKTVSVPASGLWGFFGGTTTVSLFTAQPWLVPALVGGGMVYVGLPMIMLWKAKGIWTETEKRLNEAFWSMYDTDVIVECIRCWSGLEGCKSG